jgi:hypothetical protein
MAVAGALLATLWAAPARGADPTAAEPAPPPSAEAPQPVQAAPLADPSGDGDLPAPDPHVAGSMAEGRVARAEEARGFEEPPPDEPEDHLLALPRAVLAIPSAVFGVALAPLRGTLFVIDRYHVIEHVKAFFYNDEETAAVLPVFTFGGDQGFTLGLDAFHSGFGRHGETISVSGRWGGQYTQAYDAAFVADRAAGTRLWIESLARYETQPNRWFYGYGPGEETEEPLGSGYGPRDIHAETRFRQERMLGLLRLGYTFGEPGGLVQVGATGIYNNQEFGGNPGGTRSIEEVYDTSQIAGYDRGVNHLEVTADLVIDTRDRQGATSHGFYLHAFGGGVPPQGPWRFGHYGAEATGYIDLYHGDRVLVLRAVHEAVIAEEGEVPFSDLPRLGGTRRLRGYRLDRFRDETSAVATVEYHYPIHEILAGTLFIDAGQVAPDYESIVDVRRWRLGGGGGFIIRSEDSMILSVEAAYGEGFQLLVTTDPLRAFEDRGESL